MVYCFFDMNVVEKLWVTNNVINDHVMEIDVPLMHFVTNESINQII